MFEPWVGKDYWSVGLKGVRLLVLGESHYGDVGQEHPQFTQHVVQQWGQQKRLAFFTKIAKLSLGRTADKGITNEERSEFFDRVAFYNFVQQFVPAARHRPSTEMWTQAIEPFHKVVDSVKPQVILILGQELAAHVPAVSADILICSIQHPSYSGFRHFAHSLGIFDWFFRVKGGHTAVCSVSGAA